MATCKECKLFDIESAKDKAGRVRSDWAVMCFWQSKEKYPTSIRYMTKRPETGRTTAKDGNGCPCFQKRGTK